MSEWLDRQTTAARKWGPPIVAAGTSDRARWHDEQIPQQFDLSRESNKSFESQASDERRSSADSLFAELSTHEADHAWLSPGKPTVTTDDILSIKGSFFAHLTAQLTGVPAD